MMTNINGLDTQQLKVGDAYDGCCFKGFMRVALGVYGRLSSKVAFLTPGAC